MVVIMTRLVFVLPVIGLLAGCGPQVPASNAGPGFQNYREYMRQQAARDAQLRGQAAAPAQALPGGPAAPAAQGPGADPLRTAGVQASPANRAGISDEQSFDAVSARETIESDAARRAAQAAAYQVVQPTAVPQRSGDTGPNIVAYALETRNARGQQVHARSFARQSVMSRNCARYQSDDAAQRAFLENGGPQRNYQGLDPDGDGFACGWDPAPFRLAAGG